MPRVRLTRDEHGFTLVELLVVILIIGILAAIAIPAFLHQREKAQDTEAESAVTTAVVALEAWRTEHDSFATATTTDLAAIDSSLSQARDLAIDNAGSDTYVVSVSSVSGGTFRVERFADGRTERTCDGRGSGTCGDDGIW